MLFGCDRHGLLARAGAVLFIDLRVLSHSWIDHDPSH